MNVNERNLPNSDLYIGYIQSVAEAIATKRQDFCMLMNTIEASTDHYGTYFTTFGEKDSTSEDNRAIVLREPVAFSYPPHHEREETYFMVICKNGIRYFPNVDGCVSEVIQNPSIEVMQEGGFIERPSHEEINFPLIHSFWKHKIPIPLLPIPTGQDPIELVKQSIQTFVRKNQQELIGAANAANGDAEQARMLSRDIEQGII